MDRIAIPEDQIVPMENIAAGIRGLRIAFVNVFAVTHSDGSWTLIDASLPFTATLIRHWAEKFTPTPPNAILLTHGHFDHVSAARDLADEWNVPIYAHPSESPYLTGQKEYPPPNAGAGGGAMSWLSPLYPRGPINVGDRLHLVRALDLSDLPEMPGWQILHTPGHTPGHISLFRLEDRCLLVGDAFCTTKPESFFEAAIMQRAELHGPPAYFTSDWNSACQSVQRLASLNPLIVAPGHGQSLSGANLPEKLRRLAEQFDRIAVPGNKKESAA
ncbi:MAG TPA: MBL fold metallo-hydrolase [Terriglobales bacterium]|nr:MBL fold metallo-hydrolase [Terriglobales bacterium]